MVVRSPEDAESFYFDVALTGCANILNSLLKWAPKERVLYESDFLICERSRQSRSDKALERYEWNAQMREAIFAEECFEVVSEICREIGVETGVDFLLRISGRSIAT